jgi:hypothetical protein
VITPPGSLPGAVAPHAAAELRSLAAAIGALAELEWRSPAADAYRAIVNEIARDTAALAVVVASGDAG